MSLLKLKFAILAFIPAFLTFQYCHSLKHFVGRCPSPMPVQNLNRTEFSGIWYAIQTYPADNYYPNFTCSLVDYKLPSLDGTWIRETRHTDKSGRLPSNSAEVSFLSRDGSAYLNVDSWYNFTRAQKERIAQYGQSAEMVGLAKTTETKYSVYVLATDYSNYAVFWTCDQSWGSNYQNLLITSRNLSIGNEAMETIKTTLNLQGITTTPLIKVDTSGCKSM
ncbi:uncharacterized protein LOC118433566 isoform X2 [Folsomia candida]|uniref:uncharacterized protein LOC118433566 isoform X2 n=1 Tax=Folsomia candida TaxID=158441 RepID=UPI001604DCB7|nr:uncharacterized protein LOC118433566 isoform X2 [Folsomia candida]